jgi:GNAT superfamily N-acetyltransferase
MHRRARTHPQDRPGVRALASLATCCEERDSNTLGLNGFPGEQRVVDEPLEHSPHGWTATDVDALLPRSAAHHAQVLPSAPRELEDTAVHYLRAAQAVATDPNTLPAQLAHLPNASVGPEPGYGEEMLLEDGPPPAAHPVRPTPFTATEHERASALRQVATSGPTVATAPAARADSRPGGPATALRPGSRADAGTLIAMHARSSTETIRRRYHTPMPYLSPRLAHALLAPEHGASLVMTAGPDIVGIATYARDHDDLSKHEAGLLVEDRWQRRGIGARLLYALGRHAASQGIATLTLLVQPDNHAMLATIRRAGFKPRLKTVHGLLQANISLAKPTGNSTPHEHTTPTDANTTRLIPQHPPPAA